jgi:hypothetical protein
MATLREYFDTDFGNTLRYHVNWLCKPRDGSASFSTVAKVHYDFPARARYASVFVPQQVDHQFFQGLLSSPLAQHGQTSESAEGMVASFFLAPDAPSELTSDLPFTGRLYLYVDDVLTDQTKQAIYSYAKDVGVALVIRDRTFAVDRSKREKPLAFISHDSRDKDGLVRDLALEMTKLMCPVWYDEYSLRVGDNLRESIEKGLMETKHCVLVLSPNFLSNTGWSKAEFDAIYTREIVEKKNVILPIWHDIDHQDVYAYSPRLAGKLALSSKLGVSEVARQLVERVRSSE